MHSVGGCRFGVSPGRVSFLQVMEAHHADLAFKERQRELMSMPKRVRQRLERVKAKAAAKQAQEKAKVAKLAKKRHRRRKFRDLF